MRWAWSADVVGLGCGRAASTFGRGSLAAPSSAATSASSSSGLDEHACPGGRTPAARRRWWQRRSGLAPSLRARPGRTARSGSAGRRPRPRTPSAEGLVRTGSISLIPARPSSASGAARRRRTRATLPGLEARARRRTFLRSVGSRGRGTPSRRAPAQLARRLAAAGAKRSRSTPQSITAVLRRASGTARRAGREASSRRRSQLRPADDSASRRAHRTSRRSRRPDRGRSRRAGAPRERRGGPAGTRKCA